MPMTNLILKTSSNLFPTTTNYIRNFMRQSSENPQKESESNTNTNIKFSNSKIINAYLTYDEKKLRQNGFTPENLYHSSEASFADGQKIRGRLQCNTMLRFKPKENEAEVFEKSGNLVSSKLSATTAINHWFKAYNNNYRPYTMMQKLGHQFLLKGDLQKAQTVFEEQTKTFSDNPVPHNELGVVQFIRATRQNELGLFTQFRRDAMNSFNKSKELDPNNKTADMNLKVANILNISPMYGHSEKYLKPDANTSTPMIDALFKDLRKNATTHQTSLSPGFGLGLPLNGSAAPSIQTIAISNTKTIHHNANEMALYDLGKLMNEESIAETRMSLKR